MKRYLALIAFSVIFNQSSHSIASESDSNHLVGPIQFLKTLEGKTTNIMDRLFNDSEEKVIGDAKAFAAKWCPRSDSVNGPEDVLNEVSVYCKSIGGVLDRNLCRDSKNRYHVYFASEIGRPKGKLCSTDSRSTWVAIIEPTTKGEMGDKFTNIIVNKYGYKTSEEEHSLKLEMERERQQGEERLKELKVKIAEKARLHQEALRAEKQIGEKICRDAEVNVSKANALRGDRQQIQAQAVIVGYVENINSKNNKMQIRLSGWSALEVENLRYIENINIKNIGFDYREGSIIWDHLENWYNCD